MRARARATHERPVTVSDLLGDDELARRAGDGDVAAFERLYRAHAPAVTALARRMARDPSQVPELVQDVFVRAWEQLGNFKGHSAFSTWLHRLGVNVILNRFRAGGRQEGRWIADGDAILDRSPSLSTDIDTQLDLAAALARLPEGARVVFVMHDMEGYSHEEIAAMTGTAAGTSRAQLWRARRQLMRYLDA
jgi:RNA polymerase sigma-70 factor (ECF subfamily)